MVFNLYTHRGKREGETLRTLPSLVFDARSKLETFRSTGVSKILVGQLVKVTGVFAQENSELQDVYVALIGAGRCVRRFYGVRKAGRT